MAKDNHQGGIFLSRLFGGGQAREDARVEKIVAEAKEAIRQARFQTEMANRSRIEFLSNMSHDLRTPLNAVIGFSEIIKNELMGPVGVPAYKEYAQNVFDSGHLLLKIITEILELSRVEVGNRELVVSNFKLADAVRSCITVLMGRLETAGVSMKMSVPEDLPEIIGEQAAVKKALLNLMTNALKFTPRGGSFEVRAQMDSDSGDMQIDVVDAGPGMSDEEVKKVMQLFGKTDNSLSSAQASTGYGLIIVDSLIRLHGGRFDLMSKKGAGTTARMVMPAFRMLNKASKSS